MNLEITLDNINNRLKKWAEERNIHNMDFLCLTALDNHLEEEFEYMNAETFYYGLDYLKSDKVRELNKERFFYEMIDALCDMYIYAKTNTFKKGCSYAEKEAMDKICDLSLMRLRKLNVNPLIALDECIKHIESRTQDPKQKKDWEENGINPNEKWKKDESKRDQWYKPDYSKAIYKD